MLVLVELLTMLNLSSLQTIHVSVELSGCHLSGLGGSKGMTNLVALNFDFFVGDILLCDIPDAPLMEALGEAEI